MESLEIPFHLYLWKVSSRCNLNCTYCYVYNAGDSQWRSQPKLMSENVARQTAFRMREHLEAYGKMEASIVFHGGEPFFGGVEHLKELVHVIRTTFLDSDIKISIGIQTNLTLFSPEIGDFLLSEGISVGVSIDGPPHINDIHRVDHKGLPSSLKLEEKLELLTSKSYQSIFSGFLCVINPISDPVEITDYLLSYRPKGIDFLLPLQNHDRLPKDKQEDINSTSYGDWLIRSFDHWLKQPTSTQVRFFTSIIRLVCGASSTVESLGLTPIDLIVVETNGDVEGVDSLKTTFDGGAKLGYNVFQNSFDEVAKDFAVKSRQSGSDSLCQKCKDCSLVDICGGGYLPHRYSSERRFENPSVYCSDLDKLIHHIHKEISLSLALVQE
jgi:uncharacterized protein